MSRESREGWACWLLKQRLNGDSKSTNERSPSLVGSLGLSCRYKGPLFCLGCSSRPSTKYFFPPPHTISNPLSLINQQAGQAVVVGRLSLCICLCLYPQCHTVKKVRNFPVPSRDVTAWPNYLRPGKIKLFQARESSVSYIPAGDRKIVNLFLQCMAENRTEYPYLSAGRHNIHLARPTLS